MSRKKAKALLLGALQWSQRHVAQLALFLGTLGSMWLLLQYGKEEIIPATIFASLAAWFSFQALSYTREKFRLDLFEKRLEYYYDIAGYCSLVVERAPASALTEAAHRAIRDRGGHKARLLFGKEIQELARNLDLGFSAMLKSHWAHELTREEAEETLKTANDHRDQSLQILGDLHKQFRKYIYFGDYKSD